MGIAPETLPSLFSEFEQAEDAVRRRQGGTGLGLAISRRLARAMGGDILVVSAPGHGSTFTATLRLKLAPKAASAAELADLPPASQHVLLALDRAIERRALRLSLEGAGIPSEESAIASAADMVSAAARAGEPFTRIIVDGRSGCEAAARLLSHARALAPGGVQGVIVLDTAAKADFAQFRDAGFDAYLVRPVRPQSVLTHLGAGHEAIEPVQAAAVPARPVQFLTSPSVLLVEDNDINALLARRMLEKVGCKVQHCVNGREAVEALPARAGRRGSTLRSRLDGRAHAGARRPVGDPRHQGAVRRAGGWRRDRPADRRRHRQCLRRGPPPVPRGRHGRLPRQALRPGGARPRARALVQRRRRRYRATADIPAPA